MKSKDAEPIIKRSNSYSSRFYSEISIALQVGLICSHFKQPPFLDLDGVREVG
jgi:hypothetical protein